jgi:xylulokinase
MYLGIDCGTQGTKALLVNAHGHALGRGYAAHALVEKSSGAREQEPRWWVEAMIAAVREALLQAGSQSAGVKAIGVSGQQHGLVVLDEAMNVIRPAKLWNDTETEPQNAELIQRFGGAAGWFERFGLVPRTGYTVSKLLWIKQAHPEDFARIRHVLLPHEYLNWWLTGVLCAEPGDASGTGFFDNRTRQWTREVLDFIDGGTGRLFAALPPLMQSHQAVGSLCSLARAELGMDGDCLVASGGGDNMMGAIGTGNVRQGVVTLSLGTSSAVYSFSDVPMEDSTGNVAPFCSSSGGWLPLVCTMNATNVVTSTVKLLGKSVNDIEAAMTETGPGADGLVFVPFLNGERTPDLPNARGTLSGVSALNFTPSHLIRAAVEGVSFGILNGLDLILRGRPAEVIQVIGGGARSRAWRQLLADATGARVTLPVEQESGCLGAAIQACVAWNQVQGHAISFEDAVQALTPGASTNLLQPNPELRAGYDAARRKYAKALAALYPGS